MFNKLMTMINRGNTGDKPALAGNKAPPGYFMPRSAAELLSVPQRKLLLRQIWDNTSLPEDVYSRLYLEPLKMLAACVQNVPASAEGEWNGEGGYIDLTLKFTACSVRLAKGHMFPPGAAPEEQAAKNTLWNAVIFWSALTAHLPLLTRLDGELLDGQCWMPGMTRPPTPYRFRLRDKAHPATAAVMAARLLPPDGITWLSGDLKAMQIMAALAGGDTTGMPLIKEILDKARGIVCSPSDPALVALSSVAPAVPSAAVSLLAATLPSAADAQTAVASSMDMVNTATPAAGAATELNSAIVPAQPEPQLQTVGEAESLLSAFSENTSTQREQSEHEIPSDDDDTAVLLSIFTASEPSNPVITAEPEQDSNKAAIVKIAPVIFEHTKVEEEIAEPVTGEKICSNAQLLNQPAEMESTLLQTLNGVTTDKNSKNAGDILTSIHEDGLNLGEQFLTWLKVSVNNNTLSINEKDSLLHAVSGFMFISLPGAVYKFIEAAGINEDRRAVQASLERNGVLHMRNEKRFFKVRIFENEDHEGKYQKRSGYLVKLQNFYQSGKDKIKDSRYILIEN